ncbi:hypothetical protein [Agrococcus terreus]|uniref:hypothetical protein n=1 Tax=Agrococcus terreus TaxID=574649 RepID=UPI00384A99A3
MPVARPTYTLIWEEPPKVVDDVRRRVQQQIHGHRGREGDSLYGIRNLLRAGEEHLTDRQPVRLERDEAVDACGAAVVRAAGVERHRRIARSLRNRDNYCAAVGPGGVPSVR